MKVLIFERATAPTGHPIPFASRLANSVAELDRMEVVVAFPDVIEGTECCQRYFRPHPSIKLSFYPLELGLPALRHHRKTANALVNAIREFSPDYVLVPTADGLASVIGFQNLLGRNQFLRKVPIDILLMRSDHIHKEVRPHRRLLRWLEWQAVCCGPWNRILHLDPLFWARYSHRVELCPDPILTPSDAELEVAKSALQLPENKRLIVALGNQTEEKGIDLLLNAFADPSIPDDCVLVLAGPMSAGIADLAKRVSGTKPNADCVITINRYVTDGEFHATIMAADLIATPYLLTNQPSGVLFRAIARGKPVIGTATGWIKWACENLHAGYAVDTHDRQAFAQGICAALDKAATFERSAAAIEFSDFNNLENFSCVWRRGITSQLGKLETCRTVSESLRKCFKKI